MDLKFQNPVFEEGGDMSIKLGKAIPYDIKIQASANMGIIMTIGCSTTVYSDPIDALEVIKAYIEDPEGMEKKYNEAMNIKEHIYGGITGQALERLSAAKLRRDLGPG
jgi:hypothetical protein